MIQIVGCGLLNHVQSIDWLKVLVAYIINKEEESSLQFGKVYLSPMFIYTSTHQIFPHKSSKFTNSAKFLLPQFMVYSRNLTEYSVKFQI